MVIIKIEKLTSCNSVTPIVIIEDKYSQGYWNEKPTLYRLITQI